MTTAVDGRGPSTDRLGTHSTLPEKHDAQPVSETGRSTISETDETTPLARECSSFSMSREEKFVANAVTRKLHWHIMLRFCLLTILNHMDRANLAYASVQLNVDLKFSDTVYGLGSGIFFLGYMVFQIPSQLAAEKVGTNRWIGFLTLGWGIVATCMAGLTSNPTHLYILRFLLGAFEAGTFPAMWAHITKFYAGGPDLAAAWGFIGAAQPLAQVIGAPVASGLLLTDGFLHLRGWQWLFLLEGLPTVCLGVWIWLTLAPTPLGAKFLSAAEQDAVHQQVKTNRERMGKEGGGQSTMDGIRCWKVWAQGFGSGWAGIMRYGAMYWTPLIVFFIMKGGSAATEATPEQVKVSGAIAALLAGIPYSWSAIVTFLNAKHAKHTGEMYYHLLVPLAIGALALAVLAIALGHNAYVAFFGLILSSTSQASNPLEWSYPATYLSGPALSSGWAAANCISAYGGVVGPYLIGAVKTKYGGYTIPMVIMTAVNSLAVVYFAVLLRFLPRKGAKRTNTDVEGGEENGAATLPANATVAEQNPAEEHTNGKDIQ
ncbi:Putative tartrate transporter [Coccomyxa sp. Obi]|nr:Putative tartrate transporter [Coccomyxa sp. Obi]